MNLEVAGRILICVAVLAAASTLAFPARGPAGSGSQHYQNAKGSSLPAGHLFQNASFVLKGSLVLGGVGGGLIYLGSFLEKRRAWRRKEQRRAVR